MKKIKLFALAVFAMLSTNAFAEGPILIGGNNGAYNPFTYEWSVTKTGDVVNYEAILTGFVEGITIPTEIVIPDSVTLTVDILANPEAGFEAYSGKKDFAVKWIAANAFKGNTTIAKVTFDGGKDGKSSLEVINDSAFARCTNLATVDFTKAVKLEGMGDGALKYTKIGALDLSKTVLAILPSDLLRNNPAGDDPDWTKTEANSTLKSVVLPATLVTLGNTFTACTGLEAIIIPKAVPYINDYALSGCTNLATVTFAHQPAKAATAGADAVPADEFTGIGSYAFNATKIAAITIPAWIDGGIDQAAFANCSSLKDFTYKPKDDDASAIANPKAFVGCSGVKFHTTAAVVAAYEGEENAPLNTEFDYEAGEEGGELDADELEGTPYKSNDKKFYVKYQVPDGEEATDILIDEKYGRVYAAYLDADNFTLNMVQFKKKGGKYQIAAGDVIVILTDSAKVKFTPADEVTNKGTSWVYKTTYDGEAEVDGINNLLLVDEATTKAALEIDMPDYANAIYVWINNKTKGVGFQKLGNITNIPEGTLFVYAAEPAAGARLNVVWRDENGNIEDETTAIKSIESTKAENGAIYNLQGVRVNAAKKGLYIQNGKKYIVK